MRCPQCLEQIQESIKQCQCGFVFDDVALNDLPNWFTIQGYFILDDRVKVVI